MIITKPQKNIRKDKTMKEKYEKAELEVIEFETEDVLYILSLTISYMYINLSNGDKE